MFLIVMQDNNVYKKKLGTLLMNEKQSRRDFLSGMGMAAGAVLGASLLSPLENIASEEIVLDKPKDTIVAVICGDAVAENLGYVSGLYHDLTCGKEEVKFEPNFTYFLTMSKLIVKQSAVETDIGFGKSSEEIEEGRRMFSIFANGNDEIANHGVGHIDGSNWGGERWKREIGIFDYLAREIFSDEEGKTISYKPRGHMAPHLGVNDEMFEVLREQGYLYDFSVPGNFTRVEDGLVKIGIPTYKNRQGKEVIGLAYNMRLGGITPKDYESILYQGLKKSGPLIITIGTSDEDEAYSAVANEFIVELGRENLLRFRTMEGYAREVLSKSGMKTRAYVPEESEKPTVRLRGK